jgi:hypothetical protein
MTNTFTQVFGGTTIYPSDVSYLSLTLSADITLEWPLESNANENPAARIIDVTPTGIYSIIMPPADQTGTGQTILFNNLGPQTVTVKNSVGATLLSMAQGEQWQIYLTSNTTAAGTWRVFRYGASTAQAQASALAGYGLTATGSTLSQSAPVTLFNSNYTAGATDRAETYVWNGGVGTFTLPSAITVGNDYFVALRNSGAGDITVATQGLETVNGGASLVLQPGDSATIVTDGLNWFTLGLGQSAVFAFDYTSINLGGLTGNYTLAGSELNRIAYEFTGTITGNIEVVVPNTVQQYWVYNNTTGGSYTLLLRTGAQTPGVTVGRGSRAILYCNGSEVVDAETGGIAVPVPVADGGTGATTASGARINLGGTSVGIAVFTAVDQAAAQAAIGVTGGGGSNDAIVFAVALG